MKLSDNGTDRSGTTGSTGRRLIGWKAIGQFLACTERTARRWEASRGLPVHRLPGGSRSSVWAHPDELTAWLRALPSEVQQSLREEASTDAASAPPAPADSPAPQAASFDLRPAPSAPRPAAAARISPSRLTAALLIGAVAVAGIGVWRSSAPVGHVTSKMTPGPYDDNPSAREMYMTARLELSTRSADGLEAAERGFEQLAQRYPRRAAGWSGLADTYLLLREFGAMSDEVAYPQAERAARTAVALDPKLSDAWLDQAFVEWWWQGDSADAFGAFTRALQLDPTSAKAFHWYATALYAHGEYEKGLQAIARARALDPENRAIVADEAWMRFGSGDRAAALATLEQLATLDPGFVSWHFYLAHAYLILGRDADFLREAQRAAQLRGQADAQAALRLAAARYQAGGREAMLKQLSASEAEAVARERGSAVIVAEYRALANDRDGMLHWLAVAQSRHDHNLPCVRGYPEFFAYRSDPAFSRILQGLPP